MSENYIISKKLEESKLLHENFYSIILLLVIKIFHDWIA